MSQFQLGNRQDFDYILVANQFVDNFLTVANDTQIKIYLYLLRHMNHSGQNSISSIADFFNYSEQDVLRAISYWEKQKVLQLEYNDDNQLIGIYFCDLSSSSKTSVPMPKQESVTVTSSDSRKQDYTLDQLKEFKNRETTSELLFIAESYLGKTLSANDLRSLLFISEELKFSFDLIDYLLQYCIERDKKDFRYIEKVAVSWADLGIRTPTEAQNQTARYNKNIYAVMNALGKTSQPTAKEAEFIKRWYQIYGFTSDVILEACERTVLATDKHRFEYADKILSNWKSSGIHHKTDIAKADASFANSKKKTTSAISSNKFNQFQQNEYDFDALEKELLSN